MNGKMNLNEIFSSVNEKFGEKLTLKKPWKMYLILGAVTVLVLFISTYFGLTPLNIYHGGFRTLVTILLALWTVPLFFRKKDTEKKPLLKNPWQVPLWLLTAFLAFQIIIGLITSPLFMANEYRSLIKVVDNHEFAVDVEDYTTMQIPVVDKGLAKKLGEKKLGEGNWGSQYHVGAYYMICHNDNLYWIAPIEYNDLFAWMSRGTSPGYVMINANDSTDVKIIEQELRFVDSAYLWDDLNRSNYFGNLTAWRANDAHLELTDSGEPRFVDTVYVNRIGLVNGMDVVGVIVTNPITGESAYYDYENAPTWINHVMTEEVITYQLNDWGQYVNGFFNSLFAKKDVLAVSTGINYVYSNGNMYLQTGMTSVGGDESIVGVMMVDMRTKETFFYRIGGATEYAAAQSAMGKDQEKRYTASDPIMINMDGTPTYFVMLKDDEGLVKRYAYVNVKDYNIVATGETKAAALSEYKKLIALAPSHENETYTISAIEQVPIGAVTYYYIKFNATAQTPTGFENYVFRVSVEANPQIPFLKAGDSVTISYESGTVNEITSITIN